MTLPCPASESIFPDADAPQADELPVDYQPSTEDYEWIAACDLDSFLPRNLPFADWLAEKARQLALLDDDRSQWLSSRVDELAKQACFLDARDPATFIDRDEVLSNLSANGSGRRSYRRPWIGVSVAAIGGIADWLQPRTPRPRRPCGVTYACSNGRREVRNECDSPAAW